MTVTTKIKDTKKKFAKNVTLKRFEFDVSGKVYLEDFFDSLTKFHIKVSEEALREEQAKGFDKNPRTRVDNKFEKPISKLKPFGKVEYFSKADVATAIVDIFIELERRSPFRSGKYKKSNVLFYNGQLVATKVGEVIGFVKRRNQEGGFKNNDRFRFLNTSPYARKLELKGIRRGVSGKSKRQTFSAGKRKVKSRSAKGGFVQKPNGAFFLTFRLARNRYKSIANLIKFTFMPNGTEGINIQPGTDKNGKPERTTFAGKSKNSGRPYLYPSITIILSERGIRGGL